MGRRESNGYEERRGRRTGDHPLGARAAGDEQRDELQLRVPGLRTDRRGMNLVTPLCPWSTAEIRCVPPSTNESTVPEVGAVLGLVSRIASV
jgi:hypothetical protein